MDASLRIIARHLIGEGFKVFEPGGNLALYNLGTPPESTPDLIGINMKAQQVIQVFYLRNCMSQITASTECIRAVYCISYEDFVCLSKTGRPLAPPVQGGLF